MTSYTYQPIDWRRCWPYLAASPLVYVTLTAVWMATTNFMMAVLPLFIMQLLAFGVIAGYIFILLSPLVYIPVAYDPQRIGAAGAIAVNPIVLLPLALTFY